MSQSLADLFLTLEGRIDRRTWTIGVFCVAAAGFAGVYLFNEATYDESANAIASAPTMAAFVWVIACIAAATVLTLKRLRARQRPRAMGFAAGAIAVAIAVLWGLGVLSDWPDFASPVDLVFWILFASLALALLDCAIGR